MDFKIRNFVVTIPKTLVEQYNQCMSDNLDIDTIGIYLSIAERTEDTRFCDGKKATKAIISEINRELSIRARTA